MSRPILFPVLCAALLLSASVAPAVVVVPTDFTWKGNGGNSNTNNANNWVGNVAPNLTDGSTNWENLIFTSTGANFVSVSNSGDVYGLTVTGHYHFQGNENTLSLYNGGLTYTVTGSQPNHLQFEDYADINLAADQTWNIGSGGTVQFSGNSRLEGSGQLTKTGAGTLDPNAENYSWSGGLQFNAGTIVLRPDTYGTNEDESRSLGTGTVTIGSDDTTTRPVFETRGDNSDNAVKLANNFVLNGVFASRNDTDLKLTGSITLSANTTFRTAGSVTVAQGAISDGDGSFKLTINSSSALVLYGNNDWDGGTDVTKGILVFAGDNNTPGTAAGISVGTNGYVGIGVDNSIASFVSQINTASTGTIGFDSDLDGTPDTFNQETTIDLSTYSQNLRLGSATSAILGSAVNITPNGSVYRFGGGGGWLQVNSLLTTGRTVTLDSPAELPLTVRFTNTDNAFTGLTVTNSGAVFADNALPGSAALTVNAGAYLGSEDPDVSTNATAINTFVSRLGAGTPGIIGFDIDQSALSPATRVVDLTGVSSLTGSGYFGTASALFSNGEITGPGVRFTGTIAANSDGKHRFAAYKGGALEVAGTLQGNAMIIGHPDSLGAFGDRIREEYSTVLVSGNNSGGLTGGTTLYGGRLMVGQATGDGTIGTDHTHALGEGTLTVAPVTFTLEEEDGAESPSPMLSVFSNNIIISNPIVVNAPELNLGGDNDFTLSGAISGSGELYVGEDSDAGFILRLSGANTYTGGTYVSNSALVKADSNTALGTGKLAFGNSGDSSSRVEFSTVAPVIHGLEGNQSNAEIELTSGASPRLRIVQNTDTTYLGDLRADSGTSGTDGVFVKEGTGTLRLQDSTVYSYGQGANFNVLEAKEGTLVLSNVSFENSSVSVKVNGGTLALDNNMSMGNPIDLASGRLAGYGTFTQNISIGTGDILSPGFANGGKIGTLNFHHLELDSGGTYEWNILNTGSSGGRDSVSISTPTTLVINATNTSPISKFTLKIISLDLAGVSGGALNGVDPNHGLYSWTLLSFDSLSVPSNENVFDPTVFALDVSLFTANGLTGNAAGTFSVFRSVSGNQIMLGFTPVPEPSTYALLALGLGFIGLTVWRKSRRGA